MKKITLRKVVLVLALALTGLSISADIYRVNKMVEELFEDE